jgi:hypothetical protein
MLEGGYLASNQFKPSFAHKPYHIKTYLKSVEDAFSTIAGVLAKGDAEKKLNGPPAMQGFYRLT